MENILSVIMPIYNVEPYLDRCMESLVSQTYKNLEIILVDDGSTDNCPAKCDEWANRDSRIRVIHKPNGGLSDARNKGIEIATGEYIAFLDSDDYIDPNMYTAMIDALDRTNSQIATCGRYNLYENGKKEEQYTHHEEVVLSSLQALGELLGGGIVEEAAWDKVYKKSLWKGIKFPVGEINEDIPIMPYLFERASQVVCTGKPFYYYCENPGSITHANYNEKKRIVIKHIQEVSQYVETQHPDLKDAVHRFQGRYAENFLIIFEQNPKLKRQYPEDYRFYRECTRKNFQALWNSQYRTKKQNAKLICALLGMYTLLWKLKHFE